MELYKKYRPTTFEEMFGQPEACRVLQDFIKRKDVPHAILFTGPSGVGKTTLARILREEIGCGVEDFFELNCADCRSIDDIRAIRQRMGTSPMAGRARVWCIDEGHQLTKDAQEAFLKMLEDTPRHVYFFIATTDPAKLLRTIRTRCTEIKLHPLSQSELTKLINQTAEKIDKTFSKPVISKIIEVADGSARAAMVILNKLVGTDDEDEQLSAIGDSAYETQGIELCRLLSSTGVKWSPVAKILRDLPDEPEGIRRLILNYFRTSLLNNGGDRAFSIIDIFRRDFFTTGKAGLAAACYEVVTLGK